MVLFHRVSACSGTRLSERLQLLSAGLAVSIGEDVSWSGMGSKSSRGSRVHASSADAGGEVIEVSEPRPRCGRKLRVHSVRSDRGAPGDAVKATGPLSHRCRALLAAKHLALHYAMFAGAPVPMRKPVFSYFDSFIG